MTSIIEIPRAFTPTGPNADGLAILAADLLWRTSLTKQRRSGFYIPYGRKVLYPLLGNAYPKVLRDAVAAGLVDRNEWFSKGKFPKSIRLARLYRDGRTRRYMLRRRRKIKSSIRLDEADQVGIWLVSKFGHFQIDGVARLKPWSQFAVDRINSRQHYATRCEYGRFHSTFTSLNRSLRSKLNVNGNSIVELDISNCQPLLLAINIVEARKCIHIWSSGGGGPCVDDLFLCCCVDGVLYEVLLDLAIADGLTLHSFLPSRLHRRVPNGPACRQHVKQAFVTMLFADSETCRRIPLYDTFARKFPAVAKYIDEVKRGGYQRLAHDLQRRESGLMIDGALGSLMLTEPDMPVFSVHDSVATTNEYADAVFDAINGAFEPFGIVPPIHRKDGGA